MRHDDGLRQTLAAAISERRGVEREISEIETNLATARAVVSRAESDLAALAGVGQEIREWPARAIRLGRAMDDLPPELREKRSRITHLEQQRDLAKQGVATFEVEMTQARKRLADATTAVGVEAGKIVAAKAEEVARDVEQTRARLHEAEVTLNVFTRYFAGVSVKYSAFVMDQLGVIGQNTLNRLWRPNAHVAITDWAKRLLDDAGAEFTKSGGGS